MEPNRSSKTAPEYRSTDDRLQHPLEESVVMNENRARQAVPLGHMRYVLAVSMALVIGGFAFLSWLLWT